MAKTAGFCYGVKRAVEKAEREIRAGEAEVYTLGALIHNKREMERLQREGIRIADGIDEIPEGARVIIRAHGAKRRELEELERRGHKVVDAACPDVKRIHRIVEGAGKAGRITVIIGDEAHPEVEVIREWGGETVVYNGEKDIEGRMQKEVSDKTRGVSVVYQTTREREEAIKCNEIIKKEYTNCEIFDTICDATFRRQREASELAKSCDAMLVIGDRESANTLRLAEICGKSCSQVIFIETADDLDPHELNGVNILGITAGASTPAWIIKEVQEKMTDEKKDMSINGVENTTGAEGAGELQPVEEGAVREQVAPEQPGGEMSKQEAEENGKDMGESTSGEEGASESFDEMLEKNLKTLTTGEKVSGIVQSINATEVTVDLGTKQSGYIPISELTDDPDVKPEDIVTVGAEIESYVMRVNDVEGTVMLSKKRLDTVKNWELIEKAKEEKTVLEGIVIEENKGGVIVLVKGIRVFVPASQSGLPKGADMSVVVKTRQKLRISEVNHSRRRVVGSIRAVQQELRRSAAEKTWNEIEEGKQYRGTVKSLTTYGAFVDIGGVDGMVHVSEMSWQRIRHPSEMVKVGDEVNVYVITYDKDSRKISLGMKRKEDNPWARFIALYDVGNVLPVKVVKLMQFGAFAEILPGVDGLIHVSQITNERRIEKPSEILNEGQEVEVKITNIDYEKQKVSLSMRALQEEPEMSGGDMAEAEDGAGEDTGEAKIVYDTDNPPNLPEEE